jgi:hypothetical protein
VKESRVLIFCEEVVAWTQQQNFKQLGKLWEEMEMLADVD